jgi:hypothetical protein
MVDLTKREADEKRKDMDTNNLKLQSFIYKKNYYEKEINFCRELKTPNLQ